ncbi:MAG: indolepyruvate ferredoxin oxidoreductase subunit alpha [Clostridia bacterium]|nr:indolepyruvate ferredoxin oxidoreductase subunit alpha [Clostridia bacterium]
MKRLMIGNEAVARGLLEGGLGLVSSYPGTPSTEITEFLAKDRSIHSEWAPNEKVALETAFGACLAGTRAACAMKHVGLNVAADPLFTLSYTGVNAGLVICVADDPAMHSSQNEQDSRHYAEAAKVPMLEPSDSRECHEFARAAFALSESFDTPVILRTCTRVAHSQSPVEEGQIARPPKKPYEKNIAKYVMMPGNARARHPVVEERTKALAAFAEDCPFNRLEDGRDDSVGIITSGASYLYVKEALGDRYPVLKIGMAWPLPTRKILSFAASVKKLAVVEELDPFLETHCRALGLMPAGKEIFSMIGEFSQETVARALGLEEKETVAADTPAPARPPQMCAGCPHRGMFYTLAKNKITVLGDIGCYTLGAQPPLSAVDTTLCMGASVSGIHGFLSADPAAAGRTVAVIGDSTFLHSGVTGLVNAAYNGSPATVIILDNSITGMTGHQQNPATGFDIHGDPAGKVDLEALCRAVGVGRVRVVDPYDLAACDKAVKEELAAPEPSVIISRRPCVLLKSVKPLPPLTVDREKCRSCKACLKLGCPAVSMKEGKAAVDETLCVGCGVCEGLCAFGAIGKGGAK